jgi:hypothetical protein
MHAERELRAALRRIAKVLNSLNRKECRRCH